MPALRERIERIIYAYNPGLDNPFDSSEVEFFASEIASEIERELIPEYRREWEDHQSIKRRQPVATPTPGDARQEEQP